LGRVETDSVMDQITKKPVVDGGLDNIGAEGGNR
jgi:hypothetical protein